MLKAQIIGNIGGEPNMQYSANGQGFLRFNIASNYRTRSQSGEWEDRTEWHRVVILGKSAESLRDYLKKGKQIYVEGRIETRSWDDKDGQKKYMTEIIAETVQLLGGAGGGGGRSGGGRAGGDDYDYGGGAGAGGGDFSQAPPDDDVPF